MMQPTPLSFPLLLATDGSISARLAQRLLYPAARALRNASQGETAAIDVLTVQPRATGLRGKVATALIRPAADPKASNNGSPDLSTVEGNGTHGDRTESSLDPLLTQIRSDVPADISVSFHMREGRPATEILNYARAAQVGLIAVGHRGIGGPRELLLGSVSSAIARYASCPVLVARGLPEEPTFQPRWRHILLVVNGSQSTKQAIAITRQLVPAGTQQVTILCVQPPLNARYLFGPFATPTPSWQLTQALQQVQQEQGLQIVQQAEAALSGLNLRLETCIQTSEPGPLICQIAQQQQVDVIVLSSDRHLAFRNVRLNATGDYVLHHAPCPVLLCRTSPPDGETTPTLEGDS